MNIDEWQPLAVDDPRGILLLAFMAATTWAAWRVIRHRGGSDGVRSQPATHLLPAAVLAVLTLGVVRTGAFFLIVAAPIVASEVGKIRADALRRWARPRRGPIIVGLLAAALILAVQQAPDLASAGEPAPRFSEELVAAIPETCVLLNEYDLGGFIIDRRWPEISVSQDGRNDLYGAAEIERQSRLLESSNARDVERAGVTCVLADLDRPVVPALANDPDWSEAGRSVELILLVKDRPGA